MASISTQPSIYNKTFFNASGLLAYLENPFTRMFLVEDLPMRSKHVYKAEYTLKFLLLHQLSDSIHKKNPLLYYTLCCRKPLQANHSEFRKKVQL